LFEPIPIPDCLKLYVVHDLTDLNTRENEFERILKNHGLKADLLVTPFYVEICQNSLATLLQSITIDDKILKELFRRHRPEGMNEEPSIWNVFESAKILALCLDSGPAKKFLTDVASVCSDSEKAKSMYKTLGLIVRETSPIQPICVVLVEPPEGDQHFDRDAHNVKIYLWHAPKRAQLTETFLCSPDEMKERIPQGVQRSLNELNLKGIQPRAVEVVLPFELLLENSAACVEQWEVKHYRASGKPIKRKFLMGSRYCVVLRCLDRWEVGDFWVDILERVKIQGGLIVKLTDEGFSENQNPSDNKKVVCVVANRPLTEDELEDVIFSGVPTLLWLRQSTSASSALDELHGIACAKPLDSVHERVYELRCSKHKDHIVEHLAILHDMERRELPNSIKLNNPIQSKGNQ
jgi:hypothetical protein